MCYLLLQMRKPRLRDCDFMPMVSETQPRFRPKCAGLQSRAPDKTLVCGHGTGDRTPEGVSVMCWSLKSPTQYCSALSRAERQSPREPASILPGAS